MEIVLGKAHPVVFHAHKYLNFRKNGNVQYASHWSNGDIARYGEYVAYGENKTAKRRSFKKAATKAVRDRMIYLFADHDLEEGQQRVQLCAMLFADEKGNLELVGDSEIGHYPGSHKVILLPTTINGTQIQYFALASRIQINTKDVNTWIKRFAAQEAPDKNDTNIAYRVGWVDFRREYTFIGEHDFETEVGTDENGKPIKETVSALKFPVTDPLQMANRMAGTLRTFLQAYEKEFGFHDNETSINKSEATIGAEEQKWAKYRLATMLVTAQEPTLKEKVNKIYGGALSGYLPGRQAIQESFQLAVDLAAGNLAGWLQRDVVWEWIDLNHSKGIAVVSKKKSDAFDDAKSDWWKVCVLEDVAMAIRDLHQTRAGNVLAEVLAIRASQYQYPVLYEYLFNGKPMKGVLTTRKMVGRVVSIKKLVLGRLIARGKADFVKVLKEQGRYLRDADVLTEADDIYEFETAVLRWTARNNPSALTDKKLDLNRVRIKIGKLESKLGDTVNAKSVLSMLGWLCVMESVRVYSELAKSGKNQIKDDIRLVATITSQSLATTELLLGDELKKASRAGLSVSLSAMGVVVNVVDAGLRFKEADELFSKGDTDAGLLTAASAALIITAIPLGLLGLWIGTALTIIAGIFGIIASFVKDDTWDTFLANTPFSPTAGGGSYTPDWAGVTLDALRGNTAFQLRALANLLNNFSVKRVKGATGEGFGKFSLYLTMATPDPMAVFHLTWRFRVSGEDDVKPRVTVAATFLGATSPADGKKFRVPGTIRAPDGKTSLETFEHAAVRVYSKGTMLKIGDPYDMRARDIPNHPWRQRTIKGIKVEIRRLMPQSFGRPRSKLREWSDMVVLDLSDIRSTEEVKLFDQNRPKLPRL